MTPSNQYGRKRLALVVGSGAVKCAAALGLWKVLKSEGIRVDMYVGCSGGSLYTALMALGFELDTCIQKTQKLWARAVTQKRNWPALLRAALTGVFKSVSRFAFHINGLMTNNWYRASFAFHNLAHHAEIIPILPAFDHPVGTFEIDQIPYIIEAGAHAARMQVPYLHRLLSER
jgi:predicted acylesterase/phospholipase RssA